MLKEGTKARTPAELEEAIDLLGSSISLSVGLESMYISGNTLAKNFNETISIMTEMLTEPRRMSAFEIVKTEELTLSSNEEQMHNRCI